MINLLSYIMENHIVDLETTDRKEIARALLDNCLSDINEEKRLDILQKLLNKKNGLEIDLTKGFALIHVRIDEIEEIRLAVGILNKKVTISKGKSAVVIFCIVIPGEKCRTYLSLMAHLTRLLSQPSAREVFKQDNKKGIIEYIRQFEES
jgi:mannitol/fructose-specific phosphotransferase system IIA component (Ntr-type)